ncbi:hypothetical protein CPC08DRAFT_757172 [Agrocybe pediades]|nr:hypothetical protein CPC08DRAFT_757172 [Agrocybe pediades]
MSLQDIDNTVIPLEAGATTCGYCSPPGQRSEEATSYHSATLEAIQLTCSAYQDMIDRGWRRSGNYCYKPDLKRSCCPQYTIKLDAAAFKPSRSQRQLMNRWNRFVLNGEPSTDAMDVGEHGNSSKGNHKGKKGASFVSLTRSVHEAEDGFLADEAAHKFETILEPSSYTLEKFNLYKKYQSEIHSDKRNNPTGFKRFLVTSPLKYEIIPYATPAPGHLPAQYGSYHQLYRLDGELIAMAVLDILPHCVSSVYFMYDKTWERFSLGKLSALREASLAAEMRQAGAPGMQYLYMGFYIHSCQKMKYKGEYYPSYLADPETYDWFPLDTCKPLLESHRYACFSEPSHSMNEPIDDSDEPDSGSSTETNDLDDIKVVVRDKSGDIIAVPVKNTGYIAFKHVLEELQICVRGLGMRLSKEMAFLLAVR